MNLLPPIEKNARELPHLHHAEVWQRAVAGFKIPGTTTWNVHDASRRERCERDYLAFLQTYAKHRFWKPAAVHLELVADTQAAVLYAGLTPWHQATVAPRSIGKSTCKSVFGSLWSGVNKLRRCILILGSNVAKGEERLADIKNEIMTNELLAEDYPEIVLRLREIHGFDPRRAPPECPWATDRVKLPNGVWIITSGMGSVMEGLAKLGLRPDLVFLDDIESVDAATSAPDAAALEKEFRQKVLFLHDINYPASYDFVNTIHARGCLAERLTDPKLEYGWRGKRLKALVKKPEREDLWEVFVELSRGAEVKSDLPRAAPAETCAALPMKGDEFEKLTPGHQRALQFYVAQKNEMDRGAELLDALRLPIHVCYYVIASEGQKAFDCELQGDPPAPENAKNLKLDVAYLLARDIGEEKRIAPVWAEFLTATADMGGGKIHFEVDAWDANGTSCLVDCGIVTTDLDRDGRYSLAGSQQLQHAIAEQAVRYGLEQLRLRLAEPVQRAGADPDANPLLPALVGIDCGGTIGDWAWYGEVIRFCLGVRNWIPLKGAQWSKSIADRSGGRKYICEFERNPGRRYDCNSDAYKLDALSAYDRPVRDASGALYAGTRIFYRRVEQRYCKHQTAETYIEALLPNRPVDSEWKVGWNHLDKHIPNHWWDTCWMAFALADIHRALRRQPRPQPRRFLPGFADTRPQGDAAMG